MTASDDRAARLEEAVRRKRASARSRVPELPPRPQDQPAYLGELQRSLWLQHQLEPDSSAYNLCSAFRVTGPLDVTRLERALNEVVARHHLLRSTFQADRDGVLQVVNPHTRLAVGVLEVADGAGLSAAVREAREPFDLVTGPLIRMRLVDERSGGASLLVLVAHHILMDERALGFLWRELSQAYSGQLSASPPGVQYDDYVLWARQKEAETRQADLEFWRRQLDPPPADLELPFEAPVRETEDKPGRLLSHALDQGVANGVRKLASATGASPFMVYAFAYRLLLDRYTAGEGVAFATPVSRRSHPATAEMIGYFLNPLVLAGSVDENLAVERALSEFSRDLKEVLTRASVPFLTLAEEVAPQQRSDRHPIFQTMFVYQQSPAAMTLGDASLEPVTLDLAESKFDLTLFVGESEESLEIAVEYRSDRYAEIWMESLLGHFETLLRHLPEDLSRPTAEVPMLRPGEESRLRAFGLGDALESTGAALLPEQILNQARVSRESAAVVCEGIAQSYEQLAASARALAGRLVSEGVREGDRVALFLDRSPTLVSTILGIQLAGAAYVPLDPGYPAARHRAVLEDAEVATVVTTSTLREALPQGADRVVCVDVPAGDAGEVELPTLSAQTPAYVLYTSGSTGRPKGVVVSHRNLRASNGARLQFYDAAPKRFLLLPSVAFDSSVAGIFWTLATGGTLIVPNDDEARDPRRLAEMIADEKVTSLLCVPSLYRQILEAGGRNLNDLELAIVAGESCSSRLVADHFGSLAGTRLFNEYGPTEATVWATVQELTARDAARAISIGRPIPGVRVDLLDAHGRLVPAGISGQARVAGPTVTEGYWRREEITAERFESAPEVPSEDAVRRYWTGDRMAWREDGQLLFLGRQDEQIKLRGFRIEPGEIETALVDLAGFEEAAVVARSPTETRALQLIAFVRGPSVPTNWRRDLAGRLPAHMIPARLVELPALPLLPNGKVDRRRLRDMPLESEARPEERGPVPSTREQALISLWEGLLGRSGLGPDDNFFELGGHSLLVLEMARAIERDFEVTLSAADIFESPTIRGLARRIERRGESGSTLYEHLFPIQPGGRGSPFVVAIPHFFTAMFAERFRRERPVYGLRGVGLRAEGNLGRWRTMEELGEELVDEIQRRFPDEPCMLAGYSFGASMAFEAARQMEERGLPVRRLYLIAPMPLDIYRIGPLRLQLDGLRAPVSEISTAQALRRYAVENNPWTLRPYRRGWRRLVVEPKRRLLQLYGRLRRRAGLPLSPGVLHADVRVDRFRLHSRYRPGVLHTPTIFFNATEPETDAAATWRPFFRGPLEVVEIPDPHGDPKSVEAARKVILEHLADPGDD